MAEFNSVSSDSTRLDVFFNQITNQDHDHAEEISKGVGNLTLGKYCFEVANEAADLENAAGESIKPMNA